MSNSIDFETPENVQLSYRIAGLGSRFFAWFLDSIFVILLMILIGILLAIAAAAAETTIDRWLENLFESSADDEMNDREQAMRLGLILMGLFLLIWGLGSFVYFFLAELLMRGQTPGKRMANIRVVKSDGFSLDPGSIFLRNIFRPVDQIPLLWIVPLISPGSRRFGDMVGGTLVVSSERQKINPLRSELLDRDRGEVRFRFSAQTLEKMSSDEISTIEQFCERLGNLEEERRTELLDKMVPPLAGKLNVEPPVPDEYEEFLLDVLTAEYRRQEHRLG